MLTAKPISRLLMIGLTIFRAARKVERRAGGHTYTTREQTLLLLCTVRSGKEGQFGVINATTHINYSVKKKGKEKHLKKD